MKTTLSTIAIQDRSRLISEVSEYITEQRLEVQANFSGWDTDTHTSQIELLPEHIEDVWRIDIEARIYTRLEGDFEAPELDRSASVTILNQEGIEVDLFRSESNKLDKIATENLVLIS